ncbi:hypothetical protein SNE40_022899 [Patella caerulea]|uniref:Uncharacterized protein n=1 Tax=Patella caerulea TaxID=87958 RepID=A0AAN8G567_PATCE
MFSAQNLLLHHWVAKQNIGRSGIDRYFKQVLTVNLKIIITMATSDPQLNVDHFILFAEELLGRCKNLKNVEGSPKLERKINSEIKFLKTVSNHVSNFFFIREATDPKKNYV